MHFTKFVAFFLIISCCCGCIASPAKKYPLPNQPKKNDNAQQQQNIAAEQNIIITNAKKFNGDVGIYAKNLATGTTIVFNEHKIFPTASTHKLVVSLAVYKYLYPEASPVNKNKYDTLIHKMIHISDNPAFFSLLTELSAKKSWALTQVLQDLHLNNTWIHSNKAFQLYAYHSVTTPYEMAIVMETIYQGQYLGHERSAFLKNELANTIFHDEIPRFMQSKVLHKIGQLNQLLCDVGIVDDGKNKILISIYCVTHKPENYASQFIADTSAKLYNCLKQVP